jgi:hypothetical protein
MAELLDDIAEAAMYLTRGLRSANIIRGDDPVVVRLATEAGERLELMIITSDRVEVSDRYGLRPRIADGAIASMMIAGVEFQWPRKHYAKPDGTVRRDPGSND